MHVRHHAANSVTGYGYRRKGRRERRARHRIALASPAFWIASQKKLKLPGVPASSTSNTAVLEEFRQVNPSKRSSGRTRISEEESTQASPNVLQADRPLRKWLNLLPITSRKKQLNETELALRREETARKRKNMTEKKLQDEKNQTRLRAKLAGNVPTRRADASKADSGEKEMDVDEALVVIPDPQILTQGRHGRRGKDVAGIRHPSKFAISVRWPNMIKFTLRSQAHFYGVYYVYINQTGAFQPCPRMVDLCRSRLPKKPLPAAEI
ncbi:hypothetical protein BDZ89DRAFT_1046086 [Hymenopellis radicata]|nr:hypothetical protein BDZ89DRAFT_1046086 [Hymenopellis radicata]